MSGETLATSEFEKPVVMSNVREKTTNPAIQTKVTTTDPYITPITKADNENGTKLLHSFLKTHGLCKNTTKENGKNHPRTICYSF